jgi:hypothetical protein
MIQKLIGYGFHEEDVADLKSWLEGTNADLGKNELSVTQKWSIVYKINGCSKFTAEEGKAAFDALYAADDSDTKKNYKLRIEAVNADTAAREALLTQYFDKESGMSYVELASSCAGFTSKFLTAEVKETYYETFWSKILEAMKTNSRSVAMVSPFPPNKNLTFLDPLEKLASKPRRPLLRSDQPDYPQGLHRRGRIQAIH